MRSIFIYCIIFLFIPANQMHGQELFDPENTFFSAEFEYNNGHFKKAAEYYKTLLEKGIETANIKYMLARTYLEIPGKTDSAISLLEEVKKAISGDFKTENFRENKAPYETLLYLGEAYQMSNLLNKASEEYKKYKSHIAETGDDPEIINRKLNSISFAQMQMNNPLDINKTFFPLQNENLRNYNAVVSGNNKKMAFITERKYYKAVYFSEKINGEWLDPRNITMEIESDGSFLVTSLSYNGDILYLTKGINNNDFNLYCSRFEKGKWNEIHPLKEINTLNDEKHACESPDGKFLIVSSNPGKSTGGYDLYIYSLEEGKWEDPQNLGQIINTPYNEISPFYSPDGKWLYFSSEGHNSIGGFDIYKSRIVRNEFRTPQNIGFPLNTTKDDVFFCPAKNNFTGYTAAVLNKTKNLNILKVEEFNASNPREISVKGTITTDKSKENRYNNIRVSIISTETGDTINYTKPDLSTGSYKLVMPVKKAKLIIEAPEYLTNIQELNPATSEKEIIVNTKLKEKPAEQTLIEETIEISCIHFIFDDYGLSKTSTRKLDSVYKGLNRIESVNLVIVGNPDAMGSNKYNKRKTKKRAFSAQSYLIKKGITPNRIDVKWKGEVQPVAINKNPDGTDNPQGRKFNRRVCFNFLNIPENFNIHCLDPVPENLKIKD